MNRDRALYFREGYKYQVTRPYRIKLDIAPFAPVRLQFVEMDMDGELRVLPGYAWNGASGPTIDTLDSMIGSLIHDVGYQLIRFGFVDETHKEYFDELLRELCVDDGMLRLRAAYWKWAVLNFGAGSCRPSGEPLEEVAP